ncbi:tetratricopeptide repeat protein [Leptospira weilii]|nr:tetratricopeptide repeat protein [Leptospira weilii]MDL5246691.1 tetratricopeptide repeat protein [Leptospira weilii]
MNQTKIIDLPADLVADLSTGRRITTTQEGWFNLVPINEVIFTSVQIDPFSSEENGQYYTNAVGLIGNTEAYGFYPEALLWLPRLQVYGAWDSSHEELYVFPDQTWTSMKANLVPFIEAQWGSYEGKEKIKYSTLKRPGKYPGAFDFISYGISNEAKEIRYNQCLAFLKKHEEAVLRHPKCISLEDAYTAFAKVYYVLGINDSNKENEWKEKCKTIFDYHPENRFHHEKETAAVCSWISADFGIQIFQKFLDKGEKKPEYAGGADLLSALFNDHPTIDLQIEKLAVENPKYTYVIVRCLETAKKWALTVINDKLAAKLKENSSALNSISELILRLRKAILSAPDGTYSENEIHQVRSQNVMDRVVKGWEHIKKKEYSQAEELVRSALADYPEDAQALFLDARLYWLSSNSPEAGIERARENLKIASRFDHYGVASLYNLLGCGLGELSRYDESRIAFEQAVETNPQDPMYVANLAEIWWKLERKDNAAKYAHKAKSLGSKAEFVEMILKEMKKPDEAR